MNSTHELDGFASLQAARGTPAATRLKQVSQHRMQNPPKGEEQERNTGDDDDDGDEEEEDEQD